MAPDQAVVGSKPGTIYWTDESDATSYYLNIHENNKHRGYTKQISKQTKLWLLNFPCRRQLPWDCKICVQDRLLFQHTHCLKWRWGGIQSDGGSSIHPPGQRALYLCLQLNVCEALCQFGWPDQEFLIESTGEWLSIQILLCQPVNLN